MRSSFGRIKPWKVTRLNLSVNINFHIKYALTDLAEQPPNERSGSWKAKRKRKEINKGDGFLLCRRRLSRDWNRHSSGRIVSRLEPLDALLATFLWKRKRKWSDVYSNQFSRVRKVNVSLRILCLLLAHIVNNIFFSPLFLVALCLACIRTFSLSSFSSS